MSVLENIAKKYAEEAMQYAPLACLASSIVGIALHRCALTSKDGSIWLNFINSSFGDYWYFIDILKTTSIIWLLLSLSMAAFGLFYFRFFSRWFLKKGITSQKDDIRDMYGRAKAGAQLSHPGGMEIADAWFRRSERKVLLLFKFGTLSAGICLQTVPVLFVKFSSVDIMACVVLFAFSVLIAWKFSLAYYTAVLPRKLLSDAAFGLMEPDLTSEVSNMH